MKAEPTPEPRTARASPPSHNAPADEQSIKRFRALIERKPERRSPEAQQPEVPDARAMPFELLTPAQRREDLSDQSGPGFGDSAPGNRASLPAVPGTETAPPPSDTVDRIAELQKASERALGLDRAHARPTATHLLMPGDAAIAGSTISRSTVPGALPGALDIAVHPGSQLLLADNLDTLRRRLAARGLTIGQLRLALPEDEDADTGTASA